MLTLITGPAVPLLSLSDARDHLRVAPCGSPATHPDDALIEALVGIVTDELDGVNGWLGRALIDQTWLLTLDRFPGARRFWHFGAGGYCVWDRIPLPLTSPLYSGASPAPAPVTSVTYVDDDGATQTLVEGTDYRVVTDGDPIFIEPIFGACWPDTRDIAGAVRITYQAGYGPTAASVPASILGYARIRLGQLYEFREMVVVGATPAVVPFLRDSLENVRSRGLT